MQLLKKFNSRAHEARILLVLWKQQKQYMHAGYYVLRRYRFASHKDWEDKKFASVWKF
jgi:hypothetical protein